MGVKVDFLVHIGIITESNQEHWVIC